MNLYSHRKVTPYFVPLQTFSHLFLQLVATKTSTGDKSRQLPQNLTCQDDLFNLFSQKRPSFQKYSTQLLRACLFFLQPVPCFCI